MNGVIFLHQFEIKNAICAILSLAIEQQYAPQQGGTAYFRHDIQSWWVREARKGRFATFFVQELRVDAVVYNIRVTRPLHVEAFVAGIAANDRAE